MSSRDARANITTNKQQQHNNHTKMMNLIKLATLVGLASSYARAATIRAPDVAHHVTDEKQQRRRQQQSDEEQRNSNLRGFADILLGITCTNNCDCPEGNCDMSACTHNCRCALGGCDMSNCRYNCRCAGGNCEMTSCRKNCQCEAFGCDMPICRQVCQCGGVTGDRRDMPEVAETCGTTGEGEDRGTKDIPDDQTDGNDGGGTKDIIPDDETDNGNATSPMQPMPDDGGDGGDDRGFSSSDNPTQSMPPVPAPTPRRPPVPNPPTPCKFFCGGGEGGTESNRNRNGANNRNEQVGPNMAPNIESGEDESFDLSYLYDLLRKYVGYDMMVDSGSADEGTLTVVSDTNYVVGADAAVKN